MKMLIKKALALLLIVVCLQGTGYATFNHDHQYVKTGSVIKPVPPFTYYLVTTWENTFMDNSVYIEYKSFRVYYSAPLPYNVTISYNLVYEDSDGNSSNIEYTTTGLQGTTSTYLGYYETYHQDLNQNFQSSLDLILNSVH